MGVVCATGDDVASYMAALRAGRCGIGPIETIETARLSTKIAAEVRGFDPAAHFDAKRLPMLDRISQFGLVAARQAMAQAGLAAGDAPGAAVILGAGGGQQTYDAVYEQFYGQGLNRVHPFTVPRIMPNAPASHITMEFGLRGPCFTIASACASANHAIGQAAQMVRSGMVDVAVTGGSDASVVVGFLKGWEALRVLSADTCRPFSRDRSGLVIGEGAGILVLEAADHALARGATPLMEIAGFGMTADGVDITAPDASGAARAMQAALDDAGIAAEQVGYVNAHGTGTRLNDRTEVAALRQVFGAGARPGGGFFHQIDDRPLHDGGRRAGADRHGDGVARRLATAHCRGSTRPTRIATSIAWRTRRVRPALTPPCPMHSRLADSMPCWWRGAGPHDHSAHQPHRHRRAAA